MNRYNNILLIAGAFTLASCKKFITIPPPSSALESSRVFSNEGAATAAAIGVYSQAMQTSLAAVNGGFTLYPALSSDELTNTAVNADYDGYRLNEVQPSSGPGLSRLWTSSYRTIYAANAVIEGLSGSDALPDSLKGGLRGEMLVVRALHYFYLVNLFGEVPLVLTTDFRQSGIEPRKPVTEVYNSIITDLLEAKGLLKEAYPSAGRLRPNKHTASALLARVYLFLQSWAAAEAEATAVINSGFYSLVPVLNNVFLAGSAEAVWQLSPVSTTVNTSEGNTFIPSSATTKPALALTSSLLAAFDPSDGRKGAWLKSVVVSGQTYWYPYKYKVRTGAPPYSEHYMVCRLAELYLIRAEARAQQANNTGAADDLNKVRARAGLPGTVAATAPLLLAAIMQERRVELFIEWGHRWLDLKRTVMVGNVISALKPATWQPTDERYPVPQYELDTNPYLTQNPGY